MKYTVLKSRIIEEDNGNIENNATNAVLDKNTDKICVCTSKDIERKQYARVTNTCILYKNLASHRFVCYIQCTYLYKIFRVA